MLLYYLLTTIHVIVCIILILVVLLQSGKGADLAGAFGGGATQTAFGSRGPASFLSKMTTIAAVIFMITSISLSAVSKRVDSKSILETTTGKSRPATKAPSLQPPVPAPTPEQIRKRQEELEGKQQQAKPMGATVVPGAQAPAQSAEKPGGAKQPAGQSKPPSKP